MATRNRTAGRKNRLRFVLGFAAFFALLWLLWDTPLVAPLKIFVVLLHEISHGLVAVTTGGSIDRIIITADQGGACYCGGGSAFLTLSAGYLGSLGWGALLLVLARRLGNWSRWALALIGVAVGALSLLYIRNGFGLAFGLGAGALLLAAARYGSPALSSRILAGLGLTSCLYAILDIKSDVLDRPQLPSDARMLAELTGVPTLVWGVLWIGAALGMSWLLLRWLLRDA
jgi:hypothetical protein